MIYFFKVESYRHKVITKVLSISKITIQTMQQFCFIMINNFLMIKNFKSESKDLICVK